MEARRIEARRLGLADAADAPPLFDLPDGAAVLVETVQVYVRTLNYDDFRLQDGAETEASHARGLSYLHVLYSAGDRVVEQVGGQRVDHHGSRMHAVVTEPRGNASVAERIAIAIAFAEEMIALTDAAGREFLSEVGVRPRFRVGIDIGRCVAINSGRRDEREPMFIGPAANHAAKLAAGNAEGIYLSDRIRALFGLRRAPGISEERAWTANSVELGLLRDGALTVRDSAALTASRLERWREDVRGRVTASVGPSAFAFHHHTPPLKSIDYDDLSPSRSIRMPLVSIFADLDRYTAYIDRCMANGRLAEAVRLLHILRSEFNAVLQDDFGSRKVRFIGDCIHGILAEGTSRDTDLAGSVSLAARCAGGLRSSFKLCQQLIAGANELGLAIGFELGETPVSRIGIRGNRAVRTASSLAVRASEQCQSDCGGAQSKIGPKAYAQATPAVRRLFGPGRVVDDLCYDDVETAVNAPRVAATVAGAAGTVLSAAPALAAPARAYHEG
ncbi:hypothetical protein [Sphingopyxis sp.]|uniref:hypothetical protein n=1 Tax=Sphingopyxis sp. TaxID=1908224 RepID=UPI002D780121|nr:hypothetical protein [Sphingopyxis sp.]HET6523177.1 hypothetical protein [Sphingopyxis sp.]